MRVTSDCSRCGVSQLNNKGKHFLIKYYMYFYIFNVFHNIVDFLDGQMCDGWGECFFGFNNIMTAPDGTKFIRAISRIPPPL